MMPRILISFLTLASCLATFQAFARDSPACNDKLIKGTYGFTIEGQELAGPGPARRLEW